MFEIKYIQNIYSITEKKTQAGSPRHLLWAVTNFQKLFISGSLTRSNNKIIVSLLNKR